MNLTEDTPFHGFPDHAIRTLLENPSNLREQVEVSLPALAGRLDFDRRVVLRREFVLPDWRGREADLVFRIPYRDVVDRWVLLVLLVEHQSSADPVMPLRMFLTAALFWEREWKTWTERHEPKQPLRLTPVIPLVIHTGRLPWNTNRDLTDLIDGPPELRAFAPQWRLVLWDLPEQDPEALAALAAPWLKTLAVVRSEREDAERLGRIVGRLLPELEGVHDREGMRGDELENFLMHWLARRRPAAEKGMWEQQFRELVRDPRRLKEIMTMANTAWLSAEEEAELRAQERGRLAELNRTRSMLLRLLAHRFGPLSREFTARIEACMDDDRMQAAVIQAGTVASLDEFRL